jgi:hypothetical protein
MQKGSRHKPEARAKMSAWQKASWTPEKRAAASQRNSARLLRLWKTPEFREKQNKIKARAAARRREKVLQAAGNKPR